MKHCLRVELIVAALCRFSQVAGPQTLVLSNGVHPFTSLASTNVTLTNRCELRLTASSSVLTGSLINLASPDTACVLLNVKPSTVVSTYLGQFRVNGAAATADSNCRVVQYGMGAIVVPHASSFQPLQVFAGPHFTGASMSLNQYTYDRSGLGALYANISSFKLKRGYMATFAQGENGTGLSRNYVAHRAGCRRG